MKNNMENCMKNNMENCMKNKNMKSYMGNMEKNEKNNFTQNLFNFISYFRTRIKRSLESRCLSVVSNQQAVCLCINLYDEPIRIRKYFFDCCVFILS